MKRRALKRVTASIAAALLSVTTVFSGSELSNVFSSTTYAAEEVGKKVLLYHKMAMHSMISETIQLLQARQMVLKI